MKISYPLLCYYPSQAGGPANTLYWLNKSMGTMGHHANVISTKYGLPDNDIDYQTLFLNYNINVEFVEGGLLSFLAPKRVRNLLNVDVVHFSSIFFSPTLFIIFFGLLFRKTVLISPRGELYPSALSRKSLIKSIFIGTLRLFQKRLNFHATNDYEKDLIERYFPKARAIAVLPNYIEVPKKKEISRKKQILFLGRINPIKNIDLLIRSYYKLSAQITQEFKLVICGEAKLDYEEEYLIGLRKLISELDLDNNVILLDGAFGEDKEILLSESYCTVLPSKSENFGNVVLESLCQATPVIVSKNAPWSILENFNAGFWVDCTEKAISEALFQIIAMHENEYRLMRSNALSLALSEFDIGKNIYKWEHFYESLK